MPVARVVPDSGALMQLHRQQQAQALQAATVALAALAVRRQRVSLALVGPVAPVAPGVMAEMVLHSESTPPPGMAAMLARVAMAVMVVLPQLGSQAMAVMVALRV